MLKEIQELIKTDNESQQRFKEIKKVFKRRKIVAAILLAGAAFISLFFVVYARQVKMESVIEVNKLESQISQLQTIVDKCKEK